MSSQRTICSVSGCFMNENGTYCNLLAEALDHPCPFYKTKNEVDEGRQEAHRHLVDIERFDLIRKYEYNTSKERAW